MAKETIEAVKNAENKAAQIILDAEREASELLALAGEDAEKKLREQKANEELKTKDSIERIKDTQKKDFETYKTEVLEECQKRRNTLLNNKELLMGKIIEAVKKG